MATAKTTAKVASAALPPIQDAGFLSTLSKMYTACISILSMFSTSAVRLEAIADNSLGMLEDVSANGKDYTHMVKITDMSQRRVDFKSKFSDPSEIPAALQAALDKEIV